MSTQAVPKPRRAASAGARHAEARRNITVDDVLFWLFLGALAWVPFLFASNYLVAWGLNALLFGSLVAVYEIAGLIRRRPHAVSVRRVALAATLFALMALWIWLQTVSWMPVDLQHPLWDMTREALFGTREPVMVAGSISVTPDEGLIGLVRLLTVAGAFWLSLQLCRDPRRAETFLKAIVAIGFAYALFGIAQLMFFPESLLWLEKTAYRDSLTSTFINRNSYATYAGIGLIAAQSLLIDTYRRARPGKGAPVRFHIAAMVEATLRRGVVQTCALLVILIALFLTASRAGIVASLTGSLALVIITVGMLRRKRFLPVVMLPILLVCGVAFMVYGDMFVERLVNQGGLDDRLAVAQRTVEAALDVPWTGFGFGSFDHMFSMYRDLETAPGRHWDKAHNTYAELLFELGFPAAIGFGVMLAVLLGQIARNSARREHASMVSLVALAVSVLVLLHALIDFSLQMQAVAITYWAMLGAGLAQSWSRRIDTAT